MAGNTKVEAARQALNKYPDMQIHVDDGNGNVIKVSAAGTPTPIERRRYGNGNTKSQPHLKWLLIVFGSSPES